MNKYDRGIEDLERARMEEGRFWSQRHLEGTSTPYGTGAVGGPYGYGDPFWAFQSRSVNVPIPFGQQIPNPYLTPYPSSIPGLQTQQPVNPFLQFPISQQYQSPTAFSPYQQQFLHPALQALSQQQPYQFYSQPLVNPFQPYVPGIPQQLLYNPLQATGWQTPSAFPTQPMGSLESSWLEQRSPMLRQGSRAFARPPRGYKRSDELIKDEICKRLAFAPEIDATDVDVIVKDGEVTLRGSVDDRYAKRLVEDITESTFGVRDVLNELRIGARIQEHEFAGSAKGKEK